uniref:STAS domain-containing protein n=1 Tax=Steinernema glaseri TaxID=37863 RepID=A0A1I8AKX6_9BILA
MQSDNDSQQFRERTSNYPQRALNVLRTKLTIKKIGRAIISLFPILHWLPRYNFQQSFFGDLSGGLTMAVFALPQGIAMAAVTGVDPVYGLYTAIFPTFFYIIFGNSKHHSLGGLAILSLMTKSAIDQVTMAQARPFNHTMVYRNLTDIENVTDIVSTEDVLFVNTSFDSDTNETIQAITMERWTDGYRPVKPIHVATTILFLSGVIQILMAIFKLDFFACYFCEHVMSGFVVGGCVHVFFAQVQHILGIQIQQQTGAGYLYYTIKELISHIHETKPQTLAMSICSMAFLIFGKEFLAPWLSRVFIYPVPFEFILVVLSITATRFADLSTRHSIGVVGYIPTEFPPPALPRFDLIPSIFLNTLSISVFAMVIHLTVARIVERRYEYKISNTMELYSLGFVEVFSSFFPVFPVTSGSARSILGAAFKGSTQITSLFSALALLAVIFYIAPTLEYLPKCVLASMVVVSLKAMFDKLMELRQLWPMFKTDLSVNMCIKKFEKRKGFVAMEDICKWDGKAPRERCSLVIDCSGFPYVDYLGLTTLKTIYSDYTNMGVHTVFASPKVELLKMFQHTDFHKIVPITAILPTVEAAVHACESQRLV